MRSVILDFDRREVSEQPIAEPHITSPTQALLRVHEVGVCGTDRELVNFRLRPRPHDARRIVIGHEALCQVVACGPSAGSLQPGDWVVPTVRRRCTPACSSCARGRSDLCLTYGYSERGIFNLDGYFTEMAVDEAADLIPVPASLIEHAVLLEPLSVVEKAVDRALALRQSDGKAALVLGLGPIGMLAALALQIRGYNVTIHSLEPEDHPRVRTMRAAGIAYSNLLDGFYDLILEAAGSADLALAAIRHLSSCGVLITLGAQRTQGEISFIDLIVGNQTVAGIVNASRQSFEEGVRDLPAFPRTVLDQMIHRYGFSDYTSTLLQPGVTAPKQVHRIAD